jgi:4,5-DOPA dioxygenase extradiol
MEHLPALFVSHGAPTYALEPGLAGAQLNKLGRVLPRPAAILVVSPHWMTRQPEATSAVRPRTIHDFGGFDPALYDMSYPAAGHPELAARAIDLLRAAGWASAALDPGRGLDHGAWVPLMHLYPQHEVPVFQVSLPHGLDSRSAFEYGHALAPLAEQGVLIVGSGSLTHNLFEFREGHAGEAEYAQAFTAWIRDAVQAGDATRLIQALEQAPHATRAHPTAEHFLPLLVALGAAPSLLPATVLPGGIVHGVLSMESYLFGQAVRLEARQDAAVEHV